MINYNPKNWFTFIFRIHKVESFRQLLPLMFGMAIYSALVALFEIRNSYFVISIEITRSISTIYSLLGFTLSLLLVFRTNTAYDRWWEGRRLWGDLINSSRALAAFLNAALHKSDSISRVEFSKLIAGFSFSLEAHLRNAKLNELKLQDLFMDSNLKYHISKIQHATHQPLEIFNILVSLVESKLKSSSDGYYNIYHCKTEVHRLIEICGACERIRSTPIPFSYSVFIKKFIFFYVMLFPVIYCVHMSYYIIPVTVFILYVLASLELIAEEIENPFNGDPNDLPLLELSRTIQKNMKMILEN